MLPVFPGWGRGGGGEREGVIPILKQYGYVGMCRGKAPPAPPFFSFISSECTYFCFYARSGRTSVSHYKHVLCVAPVH